MLRSFLRLAGAVCVCALPVALPGCAVDPAAAVAAQQTAVAQDPAALTRIGEKAEQDGDTASAAAFFQKAAASDAAPPGAVIGHARTLAGAGDMGGAEAALAAGLQRHPGDVALATALGRLQIVAGEPNSAVTTFRSALARSPDDVGLLTGLGVAQDSAGLHAEAQASYHRVLDRVPDNVAAQNDLALSLALTGDLPRSLQILQDLRERGLGSRAPVVAGNLALVYGLLGHEQDAARVNRPAVTASELAENLQTYAALRGGFPRPALR